MSSRGTWRSRLSVHSLVKAPLRGREVDLSLRACEAISPVTLLSCHREERSDLGCRYTLLSKPPCVVARLIRHCEPAKQSRLSPSFRVIARDVAISIVQGGQEEKREIASQARVSCHRKERGDLGYSALANSQKRDCRAALAMTRNTVPRDEPISVVRGWPGRKERLLRRLICHREERGDLAFQGRQEEKREIAALRSQ